MHHTGKKESRKEILKKEKNNKATKNLLQGYPNPDPQDQFKLKTNAPIYWTTVVNPDEASLNEVYIPFLLWLTGFKDDFFGFFFVISV